MARLHLTFAFFLLLSLSLSTTLKATSSYFQKGIEFLTDESNEYPIRIKSQITRKVSTGGKEERWTSDMGELLHFHDQSRSDKKSVTAASQRSGRQEKAPGCILYMDNRKYQLRSPKESPWTYMENRGKDLPYWMSSRIINRLYARRHGYKFVAKSITDFEDKKQPRAPAWYKVKFLQEQLACCCQWALFLDSDAYARMNDHTLSMEAWLQNLTGENYFDPIHHPIIDMKYQTWFPEDPIHLVDPPKSNTNLIGLFPRNGHSSCYFPEHTESFRGCFDFVNSGVVLLRNSSLTHEFLDDWYNDPTPNKDFIRRPWEQYRLHIIISKYRDNVVIVPHREFTGNNGRHVRHFWNNMDAKEPGSRDRLLKDALVGLAALLDSQSIDDDNYYQKLSS